MRSEDSGVEVAHNWSPHFRWNNPCGEIKNIFESLTVGEVLDSVNERGCANLSERQVCYNKCLKLLSCGSDVHDQRVSNS